ncbi:MAG: HNH endonuclease [Eubacteriales bacterium]
MDALIICFLIFLFLFLISILYIYFASPFKFPYIKIEFDITSKRQPDIRDYIDQYLINNGLTEINRAIDNLDYWKNECERKIQNSIFKKQRRKQYEICLDENNMFIFSFYRKKTRYRQQNYVRHPYSVKEEEGTFTTDYAFIVERYKKLEEIDFESTLSEYFSKNQRRLMTKELRDKIAARDNYTCQICGKYMPDLVGLHIDHIIPVSKGGKSIPSNLQVLCSRCNGSKSNR